MLALVARGLSNAETAGALHVSAGTVETHVSRMLAKLDLRDRVQADVYAYGSGLIHPGSHAAVTSGWLGGNASPCERSLSGDDRPGSVKA